MGEKNREGCQWMAFTDDGCPYCVIDGSPKAFYNECGQRLRVVCVVCPEENRKAAEAERARNEVESGQD